MSDLRDKMLAVMADVNAEVAEREELVELIAVALLTRNNLFILGKPGQAKSYTINLFRRHITGARQFERLLSKQTDEEQLFGRIDLASLIPGSVPEAVFKGDAAYQKLKAELDTATEDYAGHTDDAGKKVEMQEAADRLKAYREALTAVHHTGEPSVQTAGKIPESEIVFLDECFKANDGVLNSLLTALNERKYTNEGRTYPIPTISFFGASNEVPNFADPQEKILEALYDRLQIKVVTENIDDRDKRLATLKNKQNGHTGQVTTTVTLDELLAMQQEVSAIPVPDAINELADDLLCELRRNGLTVSDRKYLNYYPLAQAKAWLDGHDKVTPRNMLILKCYLWEKPGDRAVVESVLNRLCVNPMQDKVNDVRAMAAESEAEFNTERSGTEQARSGSRALIKLRGELVRLYARQQELDAAAESDAEKAMTAELLNDLEKISRTAAEAVNFTYMPLNELAALQ